ncbi:MAG: GNAT family N-acetyltransferase [Kineosporiaceae bacterium]
MSETLIRVGHATDPDRFLATDRIVWFEEATDESPQDALEGVPVDQRFAAEIEGADPAYYAGVYGVRPLTLTVPGGTRHDARRVPVAGLTWVGVHPDQRRRGVLTALMRHHLDRTLADGVAVSALHCSEPEIYGRYGYGMATTQSVVTLGRGTALTAPRLDAAAAELTTQLATISDRGMARRLRECDEAIAETELGTIVFAEGYYRRVVRPTPQSLRDKEPLRVLFAGRNGRDVGMALFRRTHKWERGRPGGELEVSFLGGDPAARLALLRRLVDFDLMGSVKVAVGIDDPLWHWITGPRSTSDSHVRDSLWVRLVDLPAALVSRGYEADCDVVVEVTDAWLPRNAGRWRLTVSTGEATVAPTDADPDTALDIAVLGAAWLGSTNLAAMHRAGQVSEKRPGAIRELWRALRTDVASGPSAGF